MSKSKAEETVKEAADEADEEVAVEKLDSWQLYVHVHGKVIAVSCGNATQRVKWLAHVGIARWDEETCQGWKRLGVPLSVKKSQEEEEEELDMMLSIQELLSNGDHVFVETSLSPSMTRE